MVKITRDSHWPSGHPDLPTPARRSPVWRAGVGAFRVILGRGFPARLGLARRLGGASVPMLVAAGAMILGLAPSTAEAQSTPRVTTVALTSADIAAVNEVMRSMGEEQLPAEVETVKITPGGEVVATDRAGRAVEASGLGKAWKVTKCVAYIGAFIVGNAVLVAKIRKLGGVAKVARRLLKAESRSERLAAAGAIFGEITGIDGVVSNCS